MQKRVEYSQRRRLRSGLGFRVNNRDYRDYVGVLGFMGVILGVYRDNGKEDGNYRDYRDYIGVIGFMGLLGFRSERQVPCLLKTVQAKQKARKALLEAEAGDSVPQLQARGA